MLYFYLKDILTQRTAEEQTELQIQQRDKTAVNNSVSNEIIQQRKSQRKTTESLVLTDSSTLLKCDHCGQRFASRKKFYIHLRIHGPLPYCCQFCQKTFPSIQGLRKHVRRTCQKKQQKTVIVNTKTTEVAPNRPTNHSKVYK